MLIIPLLTPFTLFDLFIVTICGMAKVISSKVEKVPSISPITNHSLFKLCHVIKPSTSIA